MKKVTQNNLIVRKKKNTELKLSTKKLTKNHQ